jgi:hypothetical protein
MNVRGETKRACGHAGMRVPAARGAGCAPALLSFGKAETLPNFTEYTRAGMRAGGAGGPVVSCRLCNPLLCPFLLSIARSPQTVNRVKFTHETFVQNNFNTSHYFVDTVCGCANMGTVQGNKNEAHFTRCNSADSVAYSASTAPDIPLCRQQQSTRVCRCVRSGADV